MSVKMIMYMYIDHQEQCNLSIKTLYVERSNYNMN